MRRDEAEIGWSGGTDDDARPGESSSVGEFLRELAVAPAREPPRPERDRTGEVLAFFHLLGVLGRGGMGVVYAALDLRLRRKVALKLLRGIAAGSDARRGRLMREARAAAAVSHPNIVAVFEVGEAEGEVYVAMELVEGTDARRWLAARPRSPRQIVEAFAMAGRGLAAAHAVHLVHRDFKPDNVLIDAAGRARVADFGLAGGVESLADGPALPGWTLPGVPLSQGERVAGTPGYIAPECLAGADADARADQFAFCVSLYEALEGRRPYDARALATRVGLRPPALRRTPLALRRALLRGLDPDPAARFPDMDALLSRLDRALGLPRRVALTTGVAAFAVAAWLGARPDADAVCEAAASGPAATWVAARDRVQATFAAAAAPYAADAHDRVRVTLDDWTARWAEVRRDTCRARTPGTADCLAGARAEFTAVVDLLQRADAQVVARAATIVDSLADPRRCLAGAVATAPVAAPAPGDPHNVRRRTAEARALLAAGKYEQGAALGDALASDARNAPALAADAVAVAALLAWKAGRPDASRGLLQARWAAERARRDVLSVELALALAEDYRRRDEPARAIEWIGHAEATLGRVGDEPRLESMVLAARAQQAAIAERPAEASELALRSLALREQALGGAHLEVADALLLAAVFPPSDRVDRAAELASRALAIRTAALGPEHPDVATAWERLGQTFRYVQDHAREREAQREALRIRTAALGPEHPDVARAHTMLALADGQLGDDRSAREGWLTARRLFVRHHGAESTRVAFVDLHIAQIDTDLGAVEAAVDRARMALRHIDAVKGPDHPHTVLETTAVAELLALHGERDEAERLYARALRSGERTGPDNPKLALPLLGLSRQAFLRGDLPRARDAAARALAVKTTMFPAEHPEMVSAHAALLDAALAAGDLPAAQRAAAACQAIADASLAESDPLRLDIAQLQARVAAAAGDRTRAVAIARAALERLQTRPWQVLRLAEARATLACALGEADPEGAGLLREALAAARAAKAPGAAETFAARCARTWPSGHVTTAPHGPVLGDR